MAHYRKIDTRLALDRKFNALTRDSKLIFFHLLTHRHLTSLGAMHATLPGLGCELGFTPEEFESAFDALCQQGMVRYDCEACFLWLPHFLKYNPPESPNAVRAWSSALNYLPECDLRDALVRQVSLFLQTLPPTFQEAVPDVFETRTGDRTVELSPSILDVTLKNNPGEGLGQDLNQVLPTQGTKHKEREREPKEKESNRENHAEQKNNGGEINTLVAPARPKHRTVEVSPLILDFTSKNNPGEGLGQDLNQVLPTQGTKNKEQRTNSKELELEQKEKEINQENGSEKKNNPGEINTIVAPTRHKKSKPPDGEVVEVFRYWQHTLGHPQAQLDTNRRQCIGKALASGYSVAQLCEAIRGCSLTPHNLGDNEQGQRYDGLHVILRHADQIDRFIRNAHSPPRRLTQADRLWADNEAAGERWMALYAPDNEEKVIHATD